MALKVHSYRDQRSSRSLFVVNRRLYITAADEVTEDPSAGVQLLAAAGASIPYAIAEAYGLTDEKAAAPGEDKRATGLEDKSSSGGDVTTTDDDGSGAEGSRVPDPEASDPSPAAAPAGHAAAMRRLLSRELVWIVEGSAQEARAAIAVSEDVGALELALAAETRKTVTRALEARLAELAG